MRVLVLSFVLAAACFGQSLKDVKVIYVDSLGSAEGADVIREKVINRLAQSHLSVVLDREQADAILTGIGEVSKGIDESGTTYDATLVIRLITQDKKILWVDEAKPSRFKRSVSSGVADKVVKDLLKAIETDRKLKE